MTDTLKSWVTRIDKEEMPVFQATVSSIAHIASREESSASELASTILRDPTLSAKILKFSNSQFYRSSATGVINTVSHAVVILGFKVIRELSLSLSIIDSLLEKDPRKNLARLLAKSFFAAVHSRTLAKEMGHKDLEEIFIAALLHDIGEMSFWCIATDEEVQKYEKALQDPKKSPEQAQLSALGFYFRDLTCQLVKKWNIHNVLEEVLQDDNLSSENTRLIHFGKKMATIDISGKESKEDIQKIKEIAKFLRLETPELKALLKKSVQLATETANAYSPVILNCFQGKDGSQAGDTDEKHTPYPKPDPILQLQILRELSTMLQKSSDINIILEALLEGIHRGVGMDRCLFALFDRHKSLVVAKFVMGITADFLMDHFIFPVDSDPNNPFADILFHRKQGTWIQNTKISQYSDKIMYQIRTTLDVDSFFITPIIVNRCPIGIFYADRQPSKRLLDEDSFASFEHLGQQAGISIEYISHK